MSSDHGVALYRKLLVENMASIQRGEDPMGKLRSRGFFQIEATVGMD